jgi:hypothetical protein
VPKAAVSNRSKATSLFDDLIGAGEQRRRDFEAERFRRLEIDDKLIFRRRLHREVSWLLALEDAIDIAGRAPVLVDNVRPVRSATARASCRIRRSRMRPAQE